MVHYRGGRAAIDPAVYPDEDEFWADLSAAYADAGHGDRRARLHLPAARRHQPGLPQRPRPAGRARRPRRRRRAPAPALHQADQRGPGRPAGRPARHHPHVPGQLPLVVGGRGLATTSWPRRCSRELGVDGFFLEYDDERSGGFAPLRFVPPGKMVVLGLVTTKRGELESKDDLKRRIDEAAQYVPLEQLCLSPQCGFSSTVEGNVAQLRRAGGQAAADRRDRGRGLGLMLAASRWRAPGHLWLVSIVLVAANLRPVIASVPPLVDRSSPRVRPVRRGRRRADHPAGGLHGPVRADRRGRRPPVRRDRRCSARAVAADRRRGRRFGRSVGLAGLYGGTALAGVGIAVAGTLLPVVRPVPASRPGRPGHRASTRPRSSSARCWPPARPSRCGPRSARRPRPSLALWAVPAAWPPRRLVSPEARGTVATRRARGRAGRCSAVAEPGGLAGHPVHGRAVAAVLRDAGLARGHLHRPGHERPRTPACCWPCSAPPRW